MALFRQEALSFSQKLDYGAPVASRPLAWTLLFLMLLVFGAATTTFLSFAQFARKETAYGILNFSKGELRMLPPRSGTIRELYVGEGQTVKVGDRLAYVSTEQQLESGGIADDHVLAALDEEQSALQAKLAALDASAPLDLQGKQEHVKGLKEQIASLQQMLPVRQERLTLSKTAADEGRDAANRGFLSGDNLRQRLYDYLTQQQSVNDLDAQIVKLQADVAELQTQIAMQPTTIAQTRADIQRELSSLEQRRATAMAQSGYLITAPATGAVTALQARIGERADPSKPLMTVVPNGSSLQAEIYVPSRAIGFIQVGQSVRLLYDAFPHERFGFANGRITDIASAVLKPDEMTAAVSLKEPAYRVIVTPDSATVHAYGRDLPLRSGIALTADIILDKRSFLGLLMDPLLASGKRIFAN